MKALLSGLMATTLAASFAIASAMPLDAAPIYAPQSEQMRADVVKVHNPWRGRHLARRSPLGKTARAARPVLLRRPLLQPIGRATISATTPGTTARIIRAIIGVQASRCGSTSSTLMAKAPLSSPAEALPPQSVSPAFLFGPNNSIVTHMLPSSVFGALSEVMY